MARYGGLGCSTDPANPTRVVTHIPFYIDAAKVWGSAAADYAVFLRVVGAAAAMVSSSDIVLSSRVPAEIAVAVMRATARGQSLAEFSDEMAAPHKVDGDSDELREGMQGRDGGNGGNESIPFDDHYPNPFGELVIVDFSPSDGNTRQYLAGLAQHQIVGSKGFYDFTRYSEEDVYITRDQFQMYCATLRHFEAKNIYLNFLRIEFDPSAVVFADGGSAGTRVRSPSVATAVGDSRHAIAPAPISILRAYAPPAYLFTDTSQVGVETAPRDWVWGGSEGLLVRPVSANSATDMAFAAVPTNIDGCWRPPHFNPAQFETRSDNALEKNHSNTSEDKQLKYIYPLQPISQSATHFNNLSNSGDVHPLYPTAQWATSEGATIAGCYAAARLQHKSDGLPRIYSAMFAVPDRRLRFYFVRPQSQFLNLRASFHTMERENVAHYLSPLAGYSNGIALLRPYPVPPAGAHAQRREGAGEVNRTTVPNEKKKVRRALMDRLSVIHHASNRYLGGKWSRMVYPLFDLP